MKAAPLLSGAEPRAKKLRPRNMSTRALLALVDLLHRAGWPTTLVKVRSWPRRVQGETYQWALHVLDGTANGAAPPWYALRTMHKGAR